MRMLDELGSIGRQPDNLIDIAEAALLLAALDLPQVARQPYRTHLNDLTVDFSASARAATPSEQIDRLRHLIYEVHRYRGDSATYDDMQNANLMRVIDRRKGLPVALGIVCLHVARSSGWKISGTGFPSHFVLKGEVAGMPVFLDPFDTLSVLDEAGLRTYFAKLHGATARFDAGYLQPISDRGILLRLQNNIKLRAYQRGETDRALEIAGRMAALAPALGHLQLDVATLQAQTGAVRSAIATLETLAVSSPQEDLCVAANTQLAKLRRKLN